VCQSLLFDYCDALLVLTGLVVAIKDFAQDASFEALKERILDVDEARGSALASWRIFTAHTFEHRLPSDGQA
jgi:hypothetical protein